MKWGFIFIIVIVIITAGLLVFNYWWLPKEEAKSPELPKITGEEAANWQSFNVDKYGFSIQIPLDYQKTDYLELDPNKNAGIELVVGFEKDTKEGFTLKIQSERKEDVTDSKETYQLEFERKENLIGQHLFPDAKIINIQKMEKKNCSIFIFTLEKDDQTFSKLVFVFPSYREELTFKMGFNYPGKDKEEIVSKMINSIECSSPNK